MKRTSTWFIWLCVLLIAAVGCSSNSAPSGPANNGNADNNVTQPETADDPPSEAGAAYPIVQEKITLTAMGSKSPAHGTWEDLAFFKQLEEVTNIHVDFDTPPNNSWNEKKNLAFASSNLPDFFYGGELSANDRVTYGTQGYLIPLEDLIEQHAPNIKKMFEDHPDIKAGLTEADGHIYTLATIASYPRNLYGSGFLIDPDVRDAIGMDGFPETTEEFYELLKEVKAEGRIPLSAATIAEIRRPLLTAYGLRSLPTGIGLYEDEVHFVPMHDNYKNYLAFMNRLYAEKLLDNDIFSHTAQEFNAKGKNGQLGVFGAFDASQVLKITPQLVVERESMPFTPMTSEVNDTPIWFANTKIAGSNRFAITSQNPDPVATIRWVDYLYSTQGYILAQYGVLLDQAFLDDPNQVFDPMTQLPADMTVTPNEYRQQNLVIWSTPRYMPEDVKDSLQVEVHINYHNDTVQGYMDKYNTAVPFPDVSYTLEEQIELNRLMLDIKTYVDEMEARFIFGQTSLDQWDSYIEQLKKMNVDRVIAINKAAYERYQSVMQ